MSSTRPEPMKKPHTKKLMLSDKLGRKYAVPRNIAEKYALKKPIGQDDAIAAHEFLAPYEKRYTKPGMLLKGLRIREGLTQEVFAKKIGVTQANLSNMEHGRRPIGKDLAKRIAKVFDVDYRYFL